VTDAFLSHYNNQWPHQRRACGNVPPRVAFPTLPTLPTHATGGWVRMPADDTGSKNVPASCRTGWPCECRFGNLLHRSLDDQECRSRGCVIAQSRQFAVWNEDQIVKRLPVPRFDRTGDDLGRLSALHPARSVGCPSTFFCPFGKKSSAASSLE
jgi:hypothetical protein